MRKSSVLAQLGCGIFVAVFLGACGLLPASSQTVEQLSGVWQYEDDQGVTSTLTIERDGKFTVDMAPEEAFLVPSFPDIYDWDGSVDWERAAAVTGEVSIGRAGQIRFATRDPMWGSSVAYEDPLRRSLSFGVGDADRAESIEYFFVTDLE